MVRQLASHCRRNTTVDVQTCIQLTYCYDRRQFVASLVVNAVWRIPLAVTKESLFICVVVDSLPPWHWWMSSRPIVPYKPLTEKKCSQKLTNR